MAGVAATNPMCPRCGYDQSGEVATWEHVCPVEGTCPECGHGFLWADLFDPRRRELPWSVESSGSGFRRLMRTPRMALRMVLPWVYWRQVGVDMAVRPRRLIGWLIWFGVTVHLFAWPFVFLGIGVSSLGRWPPAVSDVVDVFRTFDLVELAGLAVDGIVWPIVRVGLDWSGPWFSLFVFDHGSGHALRFIVGLCVTWCVVLTATPVTRRMAKLRLAHVARAGLLQFSIVLPLFAMFRFGLLVEYYSFGKYAQAAIMYTTLLGLLWSLVWWISAIRVGWQIRSSALVLLGTVAAVLGGLVAVYGFDSISYIVNR